MIRSIASTLRPGPVVLLALLLPSVAGAGTLVVDASGGGDFPDLPPAIAAAAPGDTIVVRDGVYSAFTVGKPLVLVAEAGQTPAAAAAVVTGIPPAGEVSIGGLALGRVELRDSSGGLSWSTAASFILR